MNSALNSIIKASRTDRKDIFEIAANRLKTTIQNIEKDFWVCWTLDALFNGLPQGGARLLFKGGTSLSKAFSLISRFSEDVDITVFRQDIGQVASIEELELLSGKKRRTYLDAIKGACQAYISGPLLENLTHLVKKSMEDAGISQENVGVTLDDSDKSGQSLLFWYPSVIEAPNEYIRSSVKIESGAKSALEPHQSATIRPYIDNDLESLDLRVSQITTVSPERTFWDKVIILHGQRRWFELKGELKHGGQRISRHYYDIFKLAVSDIGKQALYNRDLAIDCARHAQMFFGGASLDLEHALPGTLKIVPTNAMIPTLQRDYEAMSDMIFGEIPLFEEILKSILELEQTINI
jgi:hypothetical protein